jgi:hypothetical protein
MMALVSDMNIQQQKNAGIAAMHFSEYRQDIKYDQYRPAIPFYKWLVPIFMFLQSL